MLFLGKLAVAACCGLAAFGMANLRYYNDAEVGARGGCFISWITQESRQRVRRLPERWKQEHMRHTKTPTHQMYPLTFLSSAIMPVGVSVLTGFVVAQARECARALYPPRRQRLVFATRDRRQRVALTGTDTLKTHHTHTLTPNI